MLTLLIVIEIFQPLVAMVSVLLPKLNPSGSAAFMIALMAGSIELPFCFVVCARIRVRSSGDKPAPPALLNVHSVRYRRRIYLSGSLTLLPRSAQEGGRSLTE
jgi:hypothetical protein